MKKRGILLTAQALVLTLILISLTSALASNASINSDKLIEQAKIDLQTLSDRGIPTTRANESLQKAIQLYQAQFSLEQAGRTADYSLVNQYAQETSNVKDIALKATDELKVFEESYNQMAKDTNLSSMDAEYKAIQKSYSDERFEDTLPLIEKGYKTMSEIQASQTALNLFYSTTSRSIKQFFEDNWLKMLIIAIIILIILIIFWRTLKRLRIKWKLHSLNVQKEALHELIKKIQTDYFKYGKISDTEYQVKLETFAEMIRDIDRQIPLLREEVVKLSKDKSSAGTAYSSQPRTPIKFRELKAHKTTKKKKR